MKSSTKVEIFGRSYLIKGDADEQYTSELADYVDKRMREIAEKNPSIPPSKMAILAALNIANELFKLKEEFKQEKGQIEDKARRLIGLLDEGLSGEKKVLSLT